MTRIREIVYRCLRCRSPWALYAPDGPFMLPCPFCGAHGVGLVRS